MNQRMRSVHDDGVIRSPETKSFILTSEFWVAAGAPLQYSSAATRSTTSRTRRPGSTGCGYSCVHRQPGHRQGRQPTRLPPRSLHHGAATRRIPRPIANRTPPRHCPPVNAPVSPCPGNTTPRIINRQAADSTLPRLRAGFRRRGSREIISRARHAPFRLAGASANYPRGGGSTIGGDFVVSGKDPAKEGEAGSLPA